MDADEKIVFDNVIDWIQSGTLKLPVYSPMTMKIHGMDDYEIEIKSLERMILDDQVLAVEVLRTANSPFYGSVTPITTIRNAITRLGMQKIKRIIILVSERVRYRSWFPDLNNMLIHLWMHVSITALSAQWLSQRLYLTGMQEICFLGGLLHDIGKLAILRTIDEMRKTKSIKNAISSEALQEFIVTNHCRIGYEILKRWDIPDVYCQIARDHHNQEFAAGDQSLVIVRLANNSSSLNENDTHAVPLLLETPEVHALNINEDALLDLQKTLGIHKAASV